MEDMSYICPYCKKNVFMNLSIHLFENPCKEYLESISISSQSKGG